MLLTLLLASAIDPAEALRGPFRDFRQFIGGAVEIPAAKAAPIHQLSRPKPKASLDQADIDIAIRWSRADQKLEDNLLQAAFATELSMTDVAIEADVDAAQFPEISPMSTPEPGSYLLFGLGVAALFRRARQGTPPSRR